MTATDPNAITPERQMAAQQVGSVFNSMHEYLRGLEPVAQDDPARTVLTKQLEQAHIKIDEAAMWAIKSVLTFGVKPRPKPVEQPAEAAAASVPTDETAVMPTDHATSVEIA